MSDKQDEAGNAKPDPLKIKRVSEAEIGVEPLDDESLGDIAGGLAPSQKKGGGCKTTPCGYN